MVRKEILGASERRIIEAYVKGERLKGYTAVLFRIRQIGLRAIIEGCKRDLTLLERLMQKETSTD
jgi:DNA primase catalytic subunit